MESTIQHVQELGKRMVKLNERISLLERDSAYITSSSETHTEQVDKNKESSLESLHVAKEELYFVKNNIKNIRIQLDVIIGKLRDSTRQQDLDLLPRWDMYL